MKHETKMQSDQFRFWAGSVDADQAREEKGPRAGPASG